MPKTTTAGTEDLLGAADARKLLGISQATYYRWLKEGRLKGIKVGGRWRFHRELLEDLLGAAEGIAPVQDALEEAENLWAEHLKQAGLAPGKINAMRTDCPDEDPAGVLAQMLLEHAVARGAVDLDVLPVAEGTEVRERVDRVLGALEPVLPAECHRPLLRSLKSRAGLVPLTATSQDGRFDTRVDGRRIEARLVTYPTSRGESISIRLLDPRRINLDLGKLGLDRDVEAQVREALSHPKGVLLVNGPTDAGKTTTLYCMIETRKTPHVKIMTIEDPVELRLDGVLQAEATERFDFLTAMRAMLGSNLDIGMVSELRTPEAVGLLFTMARTGHLMLSSLHAHDSVAAINTVLEIGGVEPRLLCDNLLGVLTQRLMPRLCPDCRGVCTLRGNHAQRLGLKGADRQRQVFASKGCTKCRGTGVRGRVLAAEWLPMTPEMQSVILSTRLTPENLRAALPEGFGDLRNSVLAKMWAGQVDAETAVSALA